MDSIILDFEKDCTIRGMSPRSIPHYKYITKIFKNYLESKGTTFQDVDKSHFIGFIEYLRMEKKASGKTVENYLAILSSFYDYLAFEDMVPSNLILPIRRCYLRRHKDNCTSQERQLITVEDMARLINSEMDIRNKAIITLLAKTGIRRNELITLDVGDVDLVEMKIRLKPTAKRSNRLVFFDAEAAFILGRWLKVRDDRNKKGFKALFLNSEGDRLDRGGILWIVRQAAERVNLHDSSSERMEDHFSPHCCRHWNTTYLLRAGMKREYVQWLRGDAIKEAVDIYFHVDPKDVQEAYLASIPQLGV